MYSIGIKDRRNKKTNSIIHLGKKAAERDVFLFCTVCCLHLSSLSFFTAPLFPRATLPPHVSIHAGGLDYLYGYSKHQNCQRKIEERSIFLLVFIIFLCSALFPFSFHPFSLQKRQHFPTVDWHFVE